MSTQSWVDLNHDRETGIESLRAHFRGHAYDPHWHDSYLLGYTEQGVQQFHCRRQIQRLVPGQGFLLEPGEIHDGDAPEHQGFTYRILYLPQEWLHSQLAGLFDNLPDHFELRVASTLSTDRHLIGGISAAFLALHHQEPRIVKDACLDQMLAQATAHLSWRKKMIEDVHLPVLVRKGKAFLHAHLHEDIGLKEMAEALETDRFRLSRAFNQAFGIAPHAYLIQLRIVKARRLLALGWKPAEVATELCFSDQSHLGRWFRRAYRLTPADYQKRCTSFPE